MDLGTELMVIVTYGTLTTLKLDRHVFGNLVSAEIIHRLGGCMLVNPTKLRTSSTAK